MYMTHFITSVYLFLARGQLRGVVGEGKLSLTIIISWLHLKNNFRLAFRSHEISSVPIIVVCSLILGWMNNFEHYPKRHKKGILSFFNYNSTL